MRTSADNPTENGSSPFGVRPGEPVDLIVRWGILAVLAVWSVLLLRPFLTIALWSVVLTVALYPIFEWLSRILAGSRVLAAFVITALNLVVILGPVTWLALGLIDSLKVLSEHIVSGDFSIPPPPGSLKTWPLIGERAFEIWNLASTNLTAAISKVAPHFKPVGGFLLAVAAAAGVGMLKFIASVILSGLLFIPGPTFVKQFTSVAARLDPARGGTFIALSGTTIRNVSRGVIGISLFQALLAGLGLIAAGVPYAGLLTFGVLLLGILQIGPTIILIPLIIWSWFVMDTAGALAFSAYMLPVNLLDNVLRPLVLARGMATPMPVIFVGIIGGTLVHGMIGLFIGPIVLAVGWDLLILWVRGDQPGNVKS